MKVIEAILILLLPVIILKITHVTSVLILSFLAAGYIFILYIMIRRIAINSFIPEISLLLLGGLILGPHGISLVDERVLENMNFIEDLALGFFLFYASRHIKYKRIKNNLKEITTVFVVQTTVVTAVSILFILKLFSSFALGAVLPLAVILSSKSPEITLAVVEEREKENNFVENVLGITVMKDLFLIFILAIFIAIKSGSILSILNLLFSIAVGIVSAVLTMAYLRCVEKELPVFMTLIIIFLVLVSRTLGLNVLIVTLISGIIIENFCKKGEKALDNLKYSFPFSLSLFFFLQGASYRVIGLKSVLLLALLLLLLKITFTFISTYFTLHLLKAPVYEKKWLWTALISQSGLSLYLVNLLVKYGIIESSSIILTVFVFIEISALLAPPLFKMALINSFKRSEER